MHHRELLQTILDAKAVGLTRLLLNMPLKSSFRGSRKVRTPFGLAEVATVDFKAELIVFYIEIAKVEKWLAKMEKEQWKLKPGLVNSQK